MALLSPEKIAECAKRVMATEDSGRSKPDWEPMSMTWDQVHHLVEDLDAVMDANMPTINSAIREDVRDAATKDQKAHGLTQVLYFRYLEKS